MEHQIEKFLRYQKFNKPLRIHENYTDADDYDAEIVRNILKIQNLPLEKLCTYDIKSKLLLNIFSTFQNLNLKSFMLSGSKIKPEMVNVIINLIPNLIDFKLLDCTIQSSDLVAIIGAMEQSHLQKLSLRNVSFREAETKALISCIEKSQLVDLSLDHCNFGQNLFCSIINSFMRGALQTLDLCYVTFNREEIIALANYIEGSRSRLNKLSLFGCKFFDGKIGTMMNGIQKSSISNLDLYLSSFADGMDEIMGCIEKSSVTKLKFGHHDQLNDRVKFAVITNSIKRNNLLKEIFFCGITIDDEMADLLCDAIENSTIETIKLQACKLSSAQIIKICDATKRSSIKYLDLSLNTLDVECISAVCDLLENCDIERLNLTMCKLNDALVKSMIPCIKKSALLKIDIADNFDLSADTKRKLREIMRKQKCRATICRGIKSANKN